MIEIGLGHYLTLSAIIFTIGISGIFLNRKNVVIILMSIELILLSVNINLVSFSIYMQDIVGQIFAMFTLTVAAAEAAEAAKEVAKTEAIGAAETALAEAQAELEDIYAEHRSTGSSSRSIKVQFQVIQGAKNELKKAKE